MGVGGVGGARGGRFDEQQPVESQRAKGEAATEKAGKLPRSGWQDQEALGAAVDRARVKLAAERKPTSPRAQLASGKRADTKRLEGPGVAHPGLVKKLGGGAGVSKPKPAVSRESPVIVAKYGVPFPGGIGSQTGPVITPKYGVPRPGGGGSPDPVIVAKYGVPFPGGSGGGPSPVITPKYGVPRPGGDPPRPVITPKYGVPVRPPVDASTCPPTKPRS